MKKHKMLIIIVAVVVALGVYWFLILDRAHSSFDEYYKFRGCTQLISKTDNYGFCKIPSGQTIKIVKFNNKWFLNGDLPPKF